MADYGAKGSVPGFNIKEVVDYLQLFNSSWPLLKIDSSGQFSGTVTHGLGYPPFHYIATATGQVNQAAGVVDNYGVDSSVLARTSGAGSPRYYICRLDLTTNYIAPVIPGGSIQQTVDQDYGIKVSKPGKSVDSTDMRDFSLNSGARSLMVQKVAEGPMVNTGGGLGWEITVPHGLSYIPIAFAFIQPGVNTAGYNASRYTIVTPPVGVATFIYTVDATNVYVTADNFTLTGSPRVSVVVLKDPLVKSVVNVSYP